MRLIAMLLAMSAVPALAADTRTASEAERKAFYSFYQKRFPDEHSAKPTFVFSGAQGTAFVDSPPQRGLKPLCRMQRTDFVHAAPTKSWNVNTAPRQFVWIERGALCTPPARPVALKQRMPDSELAGLLAQQAVLLERARTLMAGNTSCASQRSYNFALEAIDVGIGGAGTEEMVGLLYRSDRKTSAMVWVRRSGVEYNAWNVNCA